MNRKQLDYILKEYANLFQTDFFQSPNLFSTNFQESDFIKTLIKDGENLGVLFFENELTIHEFEQLEIKSEIPIIYFTTQNNKIFPVLYYGKKQLSRSKSLIINEDGEADWQHISPISTQNKIKILAPFSIKTISAEFEQNKVEGLSPTKRLLEMLKMEKKDIISIYIYAILIGAISLVLPLGIQAIIGMVQGGVVFSSIYILIGLVIAALIISGVMQIMQLTLVEFLQERLFAKAAFDYTFRIPKIKAEALLKYYPPELVNRFFDIITVQKTLPKFLIDISAAIIQILFGLILLTAYHPLFIAFTVITILLFIAVIKIYGDPTLEKNIIKSKYKYKIAQWLQDIARTLYAFKINGDSNFHFYKMEKHISGYLKYRKKYFDNILIIFYNAIFFKALITGGLLILGTYLVIDRQITIGQFVASEIVIVLVVGAVEKILLNVDAVFDLLTAVDKLGYISDLPLEKSTGMVNRLAKADEAVGLSVKNLYYKFYDDSKPIINGLNLEILPRERVCITGINGSGKDTLLNILANIYTSFEGQITYNNISIKDINAQYFKEIIEKNANSDGIFDGTLLENITMNRANVTMENVLDTLSALQMNDNIAQLKDGLSTQMISTGRKFSKSFSTKITLARCIVNNPKFLLITNCFENFDKMYAQQLINYLFDKTNNWTILTVSNDPMVMQAADKVCILDEGKIVLEGPFEEIKNDPRLQRCFAF